MMRNLVWAAALAFLVGCGMSAKEKRLSDAEKDHYAALKVWMEKEDRKAFLKLKTEAERDQWLKDNGFWDRFYKYDEAERDAIVAGDVKVGFKQDMVFMAWGEPHDRRKAPGRPAERSEMFIYRFETDKDGYVYVWRPDSTETYKAVDMYHVELFVDDGVVTEMNKKDGWDQ